MEGIKILIVEDDPIFAIELVRIVTGDLGYHVAACMESGKETLDWLKEGIQPDLALLDISLKGELNGIELAKELGPIPIIFITSADVPAIYQQAREVKPYGYIVKPVGRLTLKSMVEGALIHKGDSIITAEIGRKWQEEEALNNFVFLKNQSGKLVKIDLQEIVVIESDGNYCTIHTAQDKRHVLKMSLKRMTLHLSNKLFVQIHRNYIIHLPSVESIDTTENTVRVAGKEYPLGLTFRNNLLDRLRKF